MSEGYEQEALTCMHASPLSINVICIFEKLKVLNETLSMLLMFLFVPASVV